MIHCDMNHFNTVEDTIALCCCTNRLARLWYLSSRLPPKHQLVMVEQDLVEMASSILREDILKKMKYCDMIQSRSEIIEKMEFLINKKMKNLSGISSTCPDEIRSKLDNIFR